MGLKILACVTIAAISGLFAQGNFGGLTGTVTDVSGAIVPEAEVRLHHIETNAAYSTVVTASGVYAFRSLPPGAYHLEAEKAGFKKFVRERIQVLTATVSTVDISMEVGAVTESVTVS